MTSFRGSDPARAALYLEDSYLRECDADVLSVENGKFVVLDRTIFHPEEGGQAWDTGRLVREGEQFDVVYVGKFSGSVSQRWTGPASKRGGRVRCHLDWERRHRLMRSHSALHILWTALKSIQKLEIVGTKVEAEHLRFDVRADREGLIKGLGEVEALANRIVREDRPVTAKVLGRAEAEGLFSNYEEDPSQLPPSERVRVVEVEGWDVSACTGTHVRRTLEVGTIRMLKRASKGKDIDRIYFTVD